MLATTARNASRLVALPFFSRVTVSRGYQTTVTGSILPAKIKPKVSSSAPRPPSIILTLTGPDGPGIVHAVSGFLSRRNMNIMDSAQFGDPTTGTFFMRVHASEPEPDTPAATEDTPAKKDPEQRAAFHRRIKDEFDSEFATAAEVHVNIYGAEEKPRTLIMVSKVGSYYFSLN